MFVTLLYELLKSFYVHTLTGDLARILCRAVPRCKHRPTSPSATSPSAQLPPAFRVCRPTQEIGGKTNLLKVRNFPRETRHGGVGDSSRSVTCGLVTFHIGGVAPIQAARGTLAMVMNLMSDHDSGSSRHDAAGGWLRRCPCAVPPPDPCRSRATPLKAATCPRR